MFIQWMTKCTFLLNELLMATVRRSRAHQLFTCVNQRTIAVECFANCVCLCRKNSGMRRILPLACANNPKWNANVGCSFNSSAKHGLCRISWTRKLRSRFIFVFWHIVFRTADTMNRVKVSIDLIEIWNRGIMSELNIYKYVFETNFCLTVMAICFKLVAAIVYSFKLFVNPKLCDILKTTISFHSYLWKLSLTSNVTWVSSITNVKS